MLIDWFTVGAQALNFLILVWLMKRFLYKPILNAIDAREKRIAAELAHAAQTQAAAQKERDAFGKKNADFDRQRDEQLSTMKDEVSAERKRLLDEARQAADALRTKRLGALDSELQSLHKDIVQRSREEVFATANRVLADLAGVTLQERMLEVFTQRLLAMQDAEKAALTKALASSPQPVLVRSTFALSDKQRAALQQALNETLASEKPAQFDTSPSVMGGIELSANGWKLAWNIADAMQSLEQGMGELLKTP